MTSTSNGSKLRSSLLSESSNFSCLNRMFHSVKSLLSTTLRTGLLLTLVLGTSNSFSQSISAEQSEQVAAIMNVLKQTQPELDVTGILPSPVSGLYEVVLQNGQSLYATSDAKFFIPGDIYEAKPEGLVNLGERKRNKTRLDRIAALDESDMVVFDVVGERKATLTVFTDVDCPYCRKLHAEVPELNAMGIAVRYLAFPRTGLDTETYFKMVSTWCSDDPKSAFTSVKRGGAVTTSSCENPVADQYQLGREVGVTGTPALVMEDGSIIPGYVPAATLASYLLDSAG